VASNDLTNVDHWDDVWAGEIRMRLPSPWMIVTRDLQRLLRKHVRPRDRFLEIGCAPGKYLAWVAAELQADVSGLDYSERGLAAARKLFEALRLRGDLRGEDLRETTFPPGSFDVVASYGVIEHFADPREVVRAHLRLVKPGGLALMTVPNYRGVYGRLQRYFDASRLEGHNLDIMTCDALKTLAPETGVDSVRTYAAGRLSPWSVQMAKRWPAAISFVVAHTANVAALLQPVDVPALSPMLVLEVRRAKDA
jgi:2-polyprenyl-3-methyl-5-hydroxy-6-metoxy-1,4-benzoquinol methylase